MPEKQRHKLYKRKDVRLTGEPEYPLPSGGRLDVLTSTRIAIEIERSGKQGIKKSVSSLKEAKESGIARKVRLRVPHGDLDTAYDEMRRQRVGGELTNLTGTYKTKVPKRRK
ncbi:hypothetical protein ES703_71249 [subsurface metagenome]